ncbi:dentin sialophosphoprotein-related [Euphorbia peplus]|nr:dentin sialophosphoprotein-related [Euphorbia peplus]
MYGAASKLGGRGGGRGAGATKRSSFPPPPPPHRSSTAPNSRLSLGSNPRGGGRGSGPSPSTPAVAVEESFSLIPGNNPLAFGMIIRLAPDLVEEIRKVEAQGTTARIKFDSFGSNTLGNVIDVGGKEFRFTWSREFGDLCDIYEERQSGEEGNGVLVESGSAWRKVNVQRILDESTKNHVKMRSEEAERKHKSRKAIILDHGNPSMKSQIKQLALAESNPWRFKQKKEQPFKKQKVDPPIVPKSTFKPVVSSTAIGKGRRSCSPMQSTPEQSGAPTSPFMTGNAAKNIASTKITPTQMKIKENANNLDKEILTRPPSALRETAGQKGNFGSKPMDLQSILVTLLAENPKGLSLKALEKATGEKIPNSAKKIEPIIKRIANFQVPDRYILKPGMDVESFKKPSSESGSSPEDNHQVKLVPEGNHDQRPALESRFAEKSPAVGFEEHAQSNAKIEEVLNALEKIDNQQDSPDLFGEKKISDNSEGRAGSSSDSESDSDSGSDSSDSGSDSGSKSRSRSRSKSPVASGSGSSSDSESDASSNSKEGSDEDVDILSDDDKEPQQKLQPSEPQFPASPDPWRSGQDRMDEKQDGDGSDDVDIDGTGSMELDIEGHESDAVDIEKELADDEKEVELTANDNLVPGKEDENPVLGANFLFDRQKIIGNLFDDNENTVEDSYREALSDSPERISKSNSKRSPEARRFDEKPEPAKRLKAERSTRMPISDSGDTEKTDQGPAGQEMNRLDREGNSDFGLQKGYNQAFRGKPNSEFQQPGRKSSDKNAQSKGSDNVGRSKHTEVSGFGLKFSDKISNVHENLPIQQDKVSRENQNEEEKKMLRNSKEGGPGGRNLSSFDSHHRKQGGKFKDAAQITNSQIGSSPKDGNRVDVDKYPAPSGRILQRELSELELGEFREPPIEETPVKKQFDRKGSFKQSENKTSTSDNNNNNPDLSRSKPLGKTKLDSIKPSPANIVAGFKRTPDHHIEDLTKSHHKVVPSHPQHQSKADNIDKSRQNDAGVKLGNGTESYGESHKRVAANVQHPLDSKRGPLSHPVKESRAHSSNAVADLLNGQRDTIVAEVNNNNTRKKRESSSEEESSTYSKYDKDVPEMKGPIKDHSQYKEYVQEYHDKYDSYCSLNKILENYRNDFSKMGKDLDVAKGRDMERYNKILGLLKESYRECGARHKRLKKIFIILHEELKNLKQRIKDYAVSYQKD